MADDDYEAEPAWMDGYTGNQESYEDHLAAVSAREVDIDRVEDELDPYLRKPGDELSSPHDLVTELSASELLDVLHRAGLLRMTTAPHLSGGDA